jgi:hypothetical protein
MAGIAIAQIRERFQGRRVWWIDEAAAVAVVAVVAANSVHAVA